MSEEQLKAFLEKVKSDTELQEKLKAAADIDAVLSIAKEAGFAIASEDIQSMQPQSGEVSDEELEGAAGGFMITPITPYVGIAITPNMGAQGTIARPNVAKPLSTSFLSPCNG